MDSSESASSSDNSVATVSAWERVFPSTLANVRNISPRSSFVRENISASIKQNPHLRRMHSAGVEALNPLQPLSGRSAVERNSHERLWTLDGQRKALFGKNHNGVADKEVRVLFADSDVGLLSVVELCALTE